MARGDSQSKFNFSLVNVLTTPLRTLGYLLKVPVVLVICGLLVGALSALAHPAQVHIKILVVVCQYADTETPELKSRQWADELNLGINTLYATATHQQAPEFEFVPVPGVLSLNIDYSPSVSMGEDVSTLVDDPGVIDREGVLALKYAREMVPEYFAQPVYLLAVVNRHKEGRARGLFEFPLVSEIQDGVKVNAAISVISDPLADLRPDLSSSDGGAEVVDTDGDGLSDEQEILQGTLPDRADSDGDVYSDWAEVTLGISDPLNPISKVSLPDKSISSVAHLVRHQIGHPGLHQDERYVPESSFGYWGLMAQDNSQGLSGFTRLHAQWYDTRFGELVIDVEPGGWEEPLFYLVEPSFQFIGSFLPPGVFELVRIRRPSLPDVLLEARPKFSVDASRFANGFSGLGDFSGLPSSYQAGVLVSEIDPAYEGQDYPYPGQFGVPVARVVPHEEGDVSSPGNEDAPIVLQAATVQEQQVFRDAYGLEIQVGKFDRFEGSYEVSIQSAPLPSFADLTITGAWLDSAANGYGSFSFGRDELTGDPRLGGDPVHGVQRPEFRWAHSLPEVRLRAGALEHRATFRIQNAGTADAFDIEGTVYVLPASTLPVGDGMFDREALNFLALSQEKVFVERLKPEESAEVSVTFFPFESVQAILILDPASNELVTHNNRHRSVFWTEYAALDTFYPTIETTLQFYNGTSFHHHLVAQVSALPTGWVERLTVPDSDDLKWSTPLQSGNSDTFQLHIQPPPPAETQLGVIERITLDSWMDYGDADVPAGDLSLSVVLSQPTDVSLEMQQEEDEILMTGVLTGGKEGDLVINEGVIAVEITGSNGAQQTILATTSDDGRYSVRAAAEINTVYAAVANFIGNDAYAPSHSSLIQWGTAVPPQQIQIHITSISYESGTVHLSISSTFPNPIHVQLLVSDNLFQWQEFEGKEIPSGDSQWTVDADAFDQTAFFRMVKLLN